MNKSETLKSRLKTLCLIFLYTIFVCPQILYGFYYEGSTNTFAQFPSWYPGPNGSLEFSFKSTEPEGLLLYTDDGSLHKFVELKLIEGSLRLRYNFGAGSRLLTTGKNLSDGRFHKVRIQRRYERTELIVDSMAESRFVKGDDYKFGSSNSYIWIGGISSLPVKQINPLTLPVVALEPTFLGEIKDIIYTGQDRIPRVQTMISSEGVHQTTTGFLSVCVEHNPCRNGGRCIPTPNGPKCECTFAGYVGLACEKENDGTSATFRGRDFLGWDFRKNGGVPLAALSDVINFSFKTKHPTGLLFFNGDTREYMNVGLKDGGIVVTVDMGGDPLEVNIKPPSTAKFNDNQWHRVTINRKVKEITDHTSFCSLSVSIDGTYNERRTTAGPFSQLSSSKIQLAGSDHTALLPGTKTRNNFVGCLAKVEYKTDTVRFPLIDMARKGHPLVEVKGNIDYTCQDVATADPITFSTVESYLALPTWDAQHQGSIEFKMRTTEPDGLLMFNGGTLSSQADFFALELMDGHLILHLNLGSGSSKVKVSVRRLDDGVWHEITLKKNGKNGIVTIDNDAHDFATHGDSTHLDLGGPLFVGAVKEDAELPPELWTARLRKGYVGCIKDLVINGRLEDLPDYAKKQDSGSIFPHCLENEDHCVSSPCMHKGRCQQGWGRFICDCSGTSFVGPICAKDAATLSFNGSQQLQLASNEIIQTQAEDIWFRFRTKRPNGLLMATWSSSSSDKMELALHSGSMRLTIKIADRDKIIYSGHGLNDDRWHIVRVVRRAQLVSLDVDREKPTQDHTAGRYTLLEYRNIYVGQMASNVSTWYRSYSSGSKNRGQEHSQPFVGLIQSFNFNGQYLFELAKTGHLPNVQVTAIFGKTQQIVHHPVTFKTSAAFIALHQLKAYTSTDIYFQFKTQEPTGLIMYNAGKGHDFFAIELVLGHIHLVFNLGDGPVRVRDTSRSPLNDNRWHGVTATRRASRSFTLTVDDNIATVESTGKNHNLDLQGFLYLGGVPHEMYAALPRLLSRSGYQGCLSSVDLNGIVPDPSGKDIPVPSNHVVQGCDGLGTKCLENSCANGGICNQQLSYFTCNCAMTTFTGPTCSDESTAYEFGSGTGIVTFEYPEGRWPNSHHDTLALGFMTLQKEDATVFRLDSANSNDFMELEIINGNMHLVYNLGTEEHSIDEQVSRINDGFYHVLKFTRSGPNATLQLDNYDVRSRNPKDILSISDLKHYKKVRSWIWHGHQLSVFNGQSRVQIGGKRTKRSSSVERPYQGIVSGIVVNGERPLDLAAERDSRISVEGDVHLLMRIPKSISYRDVAGNRAPNPWQQTPGASHENPGEGDDLVYSGSGPGCDVDDEDQCIPVFETGSGDDLITPVYVPSTRSPSYKHRSQPQGPNSGLVPGRGGRLCDDEEDCFIGSGSGEFNTDEEGRFGVDEGGLEFPMTPRPMLEPDVIHSEEHGVIGVDNGQYHGRITTSTTTTSWHQPPLLPPRSPPTTTTTTTTTTTRRPTRKTYYYQDTTTTTTEDYHYFEVHDYENYFSPDDINKEEKDKKEVSQTIEDIQSNSAKQTALIISIVAGILIVLILFILLWLKCKGNPDRSYKMDESKNYRTLSQTPKVVAGVQGNGMSKTADRRPVKKQSKDIKEWYV